MTLYLDSTVNFGKYSGKKVKDIPSAYLNWLRENTEHKVRWTMKPVEEEFDYDKFKLSFLQIIRLEYNHRKLCTDLGRKLIYENVQIPF